MQKKQEHTEVEETDELYADEGYEIKIKYFPGAEKIEKIAIGDWIDLRSNIDVDLKHGDFKLIPLGVAMQLPEGCEALLAPRSSSFKTWGILQTNSPGVIDESYCGDNDQWHMPVLAMRDTQIKKGDRICHFRLQEKMSKVHFLEVAKLGNKDRNGFGSTGSS